MENLPSILPVDLPLHSDMDRGILVTHRFNPPPAWPQPPQGWTPPPNWSPDPSWGPVPEGWNLWIEENSSPVRSTWFKRHKILTATGVVFGFLTILGVIGSIFGPPPRTDQAVAPAAASAVNAASPTPSISTTASSAPSVVPPPAAAPSPSASPSSTTAEPSPPAPSPSTRGLLNDVSWWNQNHQAGAVAECSTQGDHPIGTEHAWQLSGGGIACIDDQPFDTWGHRVITANIYFPRHVDEQTALGVALLLLPTDARQAGVFDGVNADWSANQVGSCRQAVYQSSTLASAVHQADPAWTADPAKAHIVFYSGHQTNEGADKPYSPSSVNLASVSIGGENRSQDGGVHC